MTATKKKLGTDICDYGETRFQSRMVNNHCTRADRKFRYTKFHVALWFIEKRNEGMLSTFKILNMT